VAESVHEVVARDAEAAVVVEEAHGRAPNERAVGHSVVVNGRHVGVEQHDGSTVHVEQIRGDIAVEGATGPVDVLSMQHYPDPVVRKKASDYLVRQGEMPGAMHFVVTEGEGGLFGIETDEYYKANLEMFRRSYAARTQLRDELAKIQARP